MAKEQRKATDSRYSLVTLSEVMEQLELLGVRIGKPTVRTYIRQGLCLEPAKPGGGRGRELEFDRNVVARIYASYKLLQQRIPASTVKRIVEAATGLVRLHLASFGHPMTVATYRNGVAGFEEQFELFVKQRGGEGLLGVLWLAHHTVAAHQLHRDNHELSQTDLEFVHCIWRMLSGFASRAIAAAFFPDSEIPFKLPPLISEEELERSV
jgi:hypothetical protein